jgi:hypothetical protein
VWNSPRREGTENLGDKTVTQQKPATPRAPPQACKNPVQKHAKNLLRCAPINPRTDPRSLSPRRDCAADWAPRSGALRPIGAIRAVYLRPQTAQRIGRSAQSAQSAQSIRARRLCSGLGAQGASPCSKGPEGIVRNPFSEDPETSSYRQLLLNPFP